MGLSGILVSNADSSLLTRAEDTEPGWRLICILDGFFLNF